MSASRSSSLGSGNVDSSSLSSQTRAYSLSSSFHAVPARSLSSTNDEILFSPISSNPYEDDEENSNSLQLDQLPIVTTVTTESFLVERDPQPIANEYQRNSEIMYDPPATRSVYVSPSTVKKGHPTTLSLRDPLLPPTSPSSNSADNATIDDAPVKSQFSLHLVLVGVALVAAFVTNNITWVYVSDYAGETYAFALDQFTTFALLIPQVPFVLWSLKTGRIKLEEIRAVPLVVLFLMGSIDAVYDTLSSMGSPYTPGPIQTIMFQLPIPLTMLLSYMATGKRFKTGQYVGGFIILGGCILSVLPGVIDVMHGKSGADNMGQQIKAASVLITFISVIFYSCNVVYKEERALKKTIINVWFLSSVVSLINFTMSFVLIPLLWIPGMGNDTPSSTFPHFWAGIKCIMTGKSDMDPSARCGDLSWIMVVNIISNVLVNVLTLQLVRSGSALLLQIVSGVQFAVSDLGQCARAGCACNRKLTTTSVCHRSRSAICSSLPR
jgi:drug/metabolite transporter (DMT)-like permease